MSSQVTRLASSPPMRDLARQKLCDMLAHCKADAELLKNLCEDAKLFRNRLSDYCPGPEHRRERELLVAVVADQGAAELYQSVNAEVDEASLRRLIRRIFDGHGFTEEGVRWAVESWILALELQVPELEPYSEALSSGDAASGTALISSAGNYDVFICYRRESAAAEARLIRAALRERNVRAFVDLADLGVGRFDNALLKHISDTPNFIVLLSQNSLDACADPKDWLRQEVLRALKTGRKIIQITMPGFKYPDKDQLHPSMHELLRHSPRIPYSNELFDGVIEMIVRLVEEQKRLRGNQPAPPPLVPPSPISPVKKGLLQSTRDLLAATSAKAGLWGSALRKSIAPLFSHKRAALGVVVALIVVMAIYYLRKPSTVDYSKFAPSGIPWQTSSAIQYVTFAPDGKTLASGGADSSVILWDGQSAKSRPLHNRQNGSVKSLAFSSDSKILASGDDTGVAIWNALTGEYITSVKSSGVSSIAFSRDGKTLANTDSNGHLYLWDTAKWQSVPFPREDAKGAFAFSPDGKTLAFSSADSSIVLLDMSSLKESAVLKRHSGQVKSLAFSTDSKVLASGGDDAQVIIWNVLTGEYIASVKEATTISSIAFSPDNKTLANTDANGGFYLWDPKTGASKPFNAGNATAKVTAFAFSPDGTTLALAAGNNVELWGESKP